MREIKFRAFHKNKMYYFGLFEGHDEWFLIFEGIPLNKDDPVMQYTGLKDRNGKEIYEGDIVKAFLEEWDRGEDLFFAEKTIYGVVKINPSRTGMIIRKVDCEEEDLKPHFLEGKFKKIKTKYDEVIGNIYENPELLKERYAK